jgi:GT2 family glycosyltransferase
MLARCLEHLHASIRSSGRTDIEVIVSDDSSDPRTERLLSERYHWVKRVAGPQRGPACNRNFGVSQSQGEWILFTDDDCIPSERWVPAYLEAIGRSSAQVFEGRTIGDRAQSRLDDEAPINVEGGCLWACNMAITRALFTRMGGFCELFPHAHEDADFRLRLGKAHEAFVFVPNALVCHPLRRARGLAFQLGAARSYLLLAERHPELMGGSPWRSAGLNFLRRSRSLWHQARRVRFRGIGFALGSLAIATYYEFMAATARRRHTLR